MQVIRKLLFPFSLVYALVVYFRNLFYNIGLIKSKSYQVTTICVGNLSVGGTGKTPMIELLLTMLQNSYQLAVLSRGYKRKSKGFVLADNQTPLVDIGDEPFQIFNKFPEVRVAVDANRQHGIEQLEKLIDPDIILLDDAYQHRKVRPDFSILLTTYQRLYVDDWYLPTGDLRDSKSASKRADIIIVTKCPPSISDNEQQTILRKLHPQPHQQVLFAYLEYHETVVHYAKNLPLDFFKDKNVTLVTGIANPSPLVNYLDENGVIFDHLSYPDHHFFTKQEISELKRKKFIITTEKDFVRLSNSLDNLYVLAVKHVFKCNGEAILEESVNQLMKANF
ncbi:tetraacyldisaccharide 4'-kinase [Maribacter sp. CXY002]|uniref:tetraacyldisaccharide 4'-kinase n=1 Tax=Maribacter luteocoastalis TaxID=3407671 RepID=UPI003B677DAC